MDSVTGMSYLRARSQKKSSLLFKRQSSIANRRIVINFVTYGHIHLTPKQFNTQTIMPNTNTSVQELYDKWNDNLYNRYLELFPGAESTVIWDGVAFPEEYMKARFKVMFLNREGYTEKDNPYCLDKVLRKLIEGGERIFPDQKNLRKRLKQYLGVLGLMGPEGFQGLSDDDVRMRVNELSDEDFYQQMKHTAYCNIKKSNGKIPSYKPDLKWHAERGLEILKEQISFFNPSIILAGDVCYAVLEELVEWGDNLFCDPEHRINVWQIKIGGELYPYVDMFHPSRRQGMKEYYLEFLHALQAVEKDHPRFWLERLDRSCFQVR